ncbi:MAG: hypothetical protein KA770_02815 [Shewanella sp.]|nr:hypothetical protein [Shewanella sp.]
MSLPKVGRSKQHQLQNGSPWAVKAVRIRYKASEAILLEVDTSDGIKMLSTKVIFGLNEVLDGLFGERNHIGINHPKHHRGSWKSSGGVD